MCPAITPKVHFSLLFVDNGEKLNATESSSYRRLIGHLIYLTDTHPDITYVANNLSQFVIKKLLFASFPTSKMLLVMVSFSSHKPYAIKSFSDYDWTTCPLTRRFVTGLAFILKIL